MYIQYELVFNKDNFALCTNTEVSILLEMRYLVWKDEEVWSQWKILGWEMSWEELSHQ